MKKLNSKLGQLVITAAFLLPLSNAFANHPVKIETMSSDLTNFENVKAISDSEFINITGNLVPNSTHHIIPGKVKIELLDEEGAVLKTVNVVHKRHKHRVNNTYMFNKRISTASLHVNKVRVMHDNKSHH